MRKILFQGILIFSLFCSSSYAAVCNDESNKIIKLYDFKPLKFEGGYFKQSYKLKSKSNIPKATAIFYLLKAGDISRLHKLSSDEIYHFYSGDPLRMLLLNPDGTSRTVILGKDILHGQQVQFIVPKDTWQGSMLIEGGCYALLGTTMTPGFNISRYQPGKRNELIKKYPNERAMIIRLTD